MTNTAYIGSTEAVLLGMFGHPQHDNHVRDYRWNKKLQDSAKCSEEFDRWVKFSIASGYWRK